MKYIILSKKLSDHSTWLPILCGRVNQGEGGTVLGDMVLTKVLSLRGVALPMGMPKADQVESSHVTPSLNIARAPVFSRAAKFFLTTLDFNCFPQTCLRSYACTGVVPKPVFFLRSHIMSATFGVLASVRVCEACTEASHCMPVLPALMRWRQTVRRSGSSTGILSKCERTVWTAGDHLETKPTLILS